MLTFRPTPWPAAPYDPIPTGRWLTVTRCPVPYVLVREVGTADPVRVLVGVPFPLEPKTRYEIRNIGDPDIDLFTSPVATDAAFEWKDRRTECIVSDSPIPGGVVSFAFTIQNANAAGVTLTPVRHTTEHLRRCATTWGANGTVTFAITAIYDPLAPVANPDVRIFKALGNGVLRVFAFSVAGNNSDTDDNAVAIAGRATVGPGMSQTVVFPVTTTPIVTCRFTGRF